jgi:CPA2 family monovalent cation:H+ antiporter-2
MDARLEELYRRARENIDTQTPVQLEAPEGIDCVHVRGLGSVVPRTAGCEECLRDGDRWVHLRVCMVCGHVGCCDNSPNKHATKHYHATSHPIIRSLEPGESWGWCYPDQLLIE